MRRTADGLHQARNALCYVVDGAAYFFGMGVAGFDTVLPLFLATLTSSGILIGLVAAIGTAVGSLPQLWTAKWVEERERRLPTVLFLSAATRFTWLLIVLLAYHIDELPRMVSVCAYLTGLTVFKLLDGGGLPAWLDLSARCISRDRRGWLWGWRSCASGLGGLAGTLLASRVLVQYAYPANYATALLYALGGLLLSHLSMSLIREPALPAPERSPRSFPAYLRHLGSIFSANPNFVRYLLVLALAAQSSLATAFYSVYAVRRWGLPPSAAGTFGTLILGAQLATNWFFGRLGDRRGFKVVLQFSLGFQALAPGLMALAGSIAAVCGVFAAYGVAMSAYRIASLNMVLEFGPPADRPTYVALANIVVAPLAIAAPLVGGLLIETVGYRITFGLTAVVMLVAFTLVCFRVQEPRITEPWTLDPAT
ncbi:MAG: MFS transporter [Betaproteobacteria bacterium]